jgi:hypothetical protein
MDLTLRNIKKKKKKYHHIILMIKMKLELGMAILHRPTPEPSRPVEVARRGRGKTFAAIIGAGR